MATLLWGNEIGGMENSDPRSDTSDVGLWSINAAHWSPREGGRRQRGRFFSELESQPRSMRESLQAVTPPGRGDTKLNQAPCLVLSIGNATKDRPRASRRKRNGELWGRSRMSCSYDATVPAVTWMPILVLVIVEFCVQFRSSKPFSAD